MSETNHEAAQRELQRRRRAILETAQRADAELRGLSSSERDPEFEEGAQKEHEAQRLAWLEEAQRLEIERIDEALERVAAGVYGLCLDCEEPIDPRRLHALPHAALCAGCAARREVPVTRSSAP